MKEKRMATKEELEAVRNNQTTDSVSLESKAYSIVENKNTGKFDVVCLHFTLGHSYVYTEVLESVYNKSEAVERFKIAVSETLL